jgi:hypothetical protein
MNQELIQKYRGVICQCCRQPIPLPAIILHMENSRGQESGTLAGGGARVFALRCRSCEREMPYRTTEIVDIHGVPKPRVSRLKRRDPDEFSRAANA